MSFQKALSGKTKTQGGMNLSELRVYLMKKYPSHAPRMKNLSRSELTGYYHKNIGKKNFRENSRKTSRQNSANNFYFLKDAKISESQKKYCRCVAHVASKNDEWCYIHNAWKKPTGNTGRKCYNPYAVCTKTTHRSGAGSRECLKYMDLGNMPLSEVKALANLKGVSVSELKRKVQRER